jgi:tetratricopeptide (TPR) repeat protein
MGAPMMENASTSLPRSIPGDDPSSATKAASLEETYTSLIQEYLQVMCLENATFLAERLVASCKSTNALYLLAICHYRSGAYRRALMVLEDVKATNPATDYLTAKCCYDLECYGRAEEALLHQARSDFKMTVAAGGTSNMDEWMLETSPCPIPNGAAGLYLLGNICRKSSRKQRAMKYYRMSLQVRTDCTALLCSALHCTLVDRSVGMYMKSTCTNSDILFTFSPLTIKSVSISLF